MNNILSLRGNRFTSKSKKSSRGPAKLPRNSIVSLERLKEIHTSLEKVNEFWEKQSILSGILIGVYYNCIVAKSNRVTGYLKGRGNMIPNDTIVGAKFNHNKTKHIIIHYISKDDFEKTLKISQQVIALFEESFPSGEVNDKQFLDSQLFNSLAYKKYALSKTIFKDFLRDSYFIERFGIEEIRENDLKNSIVTFYDVGTEIRTVLKKINVDISEANVMDRTTVLLDEKNLELVLNKVPYLVSMIVEDFSKLSKDDFQEASFYIETQIPSPYNEPTIGVIDTLFDTNVYFSEWVEYHDLISDDIRKETVDYQHGTAVTSLIVDGPNLNNNLDDGCGRFKVRHFGVSLHSGFNSFTIIKQIKEIISQNTDIKVWNLSLGSNDEIRENFISAEASVLDEIQYQHDVIFIIAGTNARLLTGKRKRIGAPADSLNSITVNAVDFDNKPASYSREGVVLSFFIKPDIAYYGGGNGQFINVCEPLGLGKVSGTSFAAPLIARKMAYLIHIMGLNREEAKAVLIDSAISWNKNDSFEKLTLIGNGIVPIKMEDILMTADDEIKFIVSDFSEAYESYNYDFPVPISEGCYPYVARATMCYFPNCSRNQGVDYTNTELQLTIGPLEQSGIKPINKDKQHQEDSPGYIREKSARNIYRKWDNVKHVTEKFSNKKRPKSVNNPGNPQWGMCVKAIERLKRRDGRGVRFGIVVTLKELNGVNRIEDFVQQSMLRGWLVNELQVESQIEIYNKLNEEVEFE